MTAADMAPTRAQVAVRGRAWIPFLIGFGLLWGTLAGLSEFDATGRWGIPILAGVIVVALLVSRLVFRTPWRASITQLGLTRPGWRALALAVVVSALVLLIYPITRLVTGAELEVVADWPWVLIGLFAFHGLAEELVWRGYAFRRLRVGRSFPRAVLWTMPLVAAAHIPIIVSSGPLVGIGAMLVAAVTSIPFAYLYETGRGTVWAPAILHTAIDSFKLFVLPPEATTTFSLLLIVISLTVPLLVLVVRRRFLTTGALSA
jgi:membrane protease YdiL (CAAX protease family)